MYESVALHHCSPTDLVYYSVYIYVCMYKLCLRVSDACTVRYVVNNLTSVEPYRAANHLAVETSPM